MANLRFIPILLSIISVINSNSITEAQHNQIKFLVENKTTNLIKALDGSFHSIIPDNFDWRKQYPNCFRAVKTQGKCSSSFALSVSATLESRICINSNGNNNFELSPQDILSCGFNEKRCKLEASLKDTWEYVERNGLLTEKCLPYLSKEGSVVPQCPSSCVYNKDPFYRYKALIGSFHVVKGIEEIKTEIMIYGPVTTVMTVFEDFALYNGGIYEYQYGKQMSDLSVTIVGWGKENGIDFWIVRNTWGMYWGENGYFRIKMNDAKSNIENNVGVSKSLLWY
jgi:C1A family cysteine protease